VCYCVCYCASIWYCHFSSHTHYLVVVLFYSIPFTFLPLNSIPQHNTNITDGKYIQHRMFRDSCLAVEGNFLKDLNVLGRDLSKTVLVDNSPHAFGYQVDNGIPIESWFDDPNDTELLKLERFLRTLQHAPDVRKVVRNKFQTHRLIAEA
jgi:hypothetical protein